MDKALHRGKNRFAAPSPFAGVDESNSSEEKCGARAAKVKKIDRGL